MFCPTAVDQFFATKLAKLDLNRNNSRTDGCGQFTNCNDCTWEYDDLDCGFCYTPGAGGPQVNN